MIPIKLILFFVLLVKPTICTDWYESFVNKSEFHLRSRKEMRLLHDAQLQEPLDLQSDMPEWAKITTRADGSWICDRPWPTMEFFLPVAMQTNQRDSRFYEYETLFLRSFMLFWQLDRMNVSMRLLFDADLINERKHIYNMIVSTFQPYHHRFAGGLHFTHVNPSMYYHNGGERQQLMMLWADNFTTAEYVAFVDTDCVFLTYIDREDIFVDGKPVINGKAGPSGDSFWQRGPQFSFALTGLEEPMRCMSYFPVVIKTKHLQDLREHVVRTHGGNKTFNEIYYNVTAAFGAFQFNALCTYLFYYKRNEYAFFAHPVVKLPWDGVHPPPDKGMIQNFSIFEKIPNIFEPKPRIATHSRYRGWKSKYMMSIGANRAHMNILMQQGVCISPPLISNHSNYRLSYVHRDDSVCENITFFQKPGMNGIHSIQELGYYEEMHIFEYLDWTNLVPEAQIKNQYNLRIERIRHCNFTFDVAEYKNIMRRPEQMQNGGFRARRLR